MVLLSGRTKDWSGMRVKQNPQMTGLLLPLSVKFSRPSPTVVGEKQESPAMPSCCTKERN